MCKAKRITSNAGLGLATLCRLVLGYELDKSDTVRLGSWVGPLSKKKKQYAARDAWASLLIYFEAMRRSSDSFSYGSVCPPTIRSGLDVLSRYSSNDLTAETIELEGLSTIPTRVLLDLFHAMDRLKPSSKHPATPLFYRKLRDTLFELNSEDVAKVSKHLENVGDTFENKFNTNPRYVLQRVRRVVVAPPILEQRLKNLSEEFSRNTYNDSKGLPLLSEAVKKEMRNLLKHVRAGCLSDPRDISLYIVSGFDRDGLRLYNSIRGTR